jgi:Response regulator containing a CheY-like receiver domain and an HTH DNA-binding domain
MAVLSEPAEKPPAPGDHLRVIVSAESAETHRRTARTLADLDLEASLEQIGAPSELFELEVNPTAIVVLFCDVDLPRDMATLRRLRRELREQAIVAISPVATGTGVRRALDAGADAIVFEPELESTLAVAVSAVASGQSVVPRKLRASVERPAFSHRERQVLAFVSRGLTNAQIAEKLFLSESTIKSHLSSAFAKFGVRSRKEAAALFLELEQTTGALPAGPEPVLSVGALKGATT